MVLRVGIAGLVHDHIWGLLTDWDGVPDAQIVGIAEANRTLHARAAAGRPGVVLYDSWRDMLDSAELDILVVTTDNRMARPVVEAGAARRIAVMLEKPLAADIEDGQRIYDVALGAGIPFMVNWFTMWIPEITTALTMARRGDIGRPHYFRFRIAHAGPREIGCTPEFYSWLYDADRSGGGALVDFSGYGAYMASFLFGTPSDVTAVAGNWVKDELSVEDNGIVCLHYPRGVAICEGSWTQMGPTQLDGPTIHGDRGSLWIHDGRVHMRTSTEGNARVVPVEPLDNVHRSGPAFFSHCVASDLPIEGLYDPYHSLISQRAVSAGLRAAAQGRRVSI